MGRHGVQSATASFGQNHNGNASLPETEAAAVDYGSLLGWYVFPVGPDCRVPWTGDRETRGHGYKDAQREPDAIRALWRGRRTNIALACGPHSGVVALDVDVKDGALGDDSLAFLVRRFGELPVTWTTATPSGGRHYLFRHPDRAIRNRVGLHIIEADGSKTKLAGLDVRASGGSIALPPSRKPSGPYRWLVDPADGGPLADLPGWLAEVFDPPPPPRRPPEPIRMTALDRVAKYVAAAINAECRDLASTARGAGRNQRLFMAAANLGEFVGAGLLSQAIAEDALEAAASDCGLWSEDGAHACRATIASGMTKGIANPRDVRA